MTAVDEPSLLRFLLDRFDEDERLIIRGTPIPEGDWEPDFHGRFLDRGSLIERVRTDRQVVLLAVEWMQKAQGEPPIANPPPQDPETLLGSDILKLMADRYRDHPDYRSTWASGYVL